MNLSPLFDVNIGAAGGTDEDLPPWRPPAGMLAAVNLNAIADVVPYNDPGYAANGPKFPRNSAYDQIGINWATAAYTPFVGRFGAYIVCSGGHNTYYGNERYLFTLDDQLWRRYGPWGPGDPKVNLLGITDNALQYDSTHNAEGGTTPPFIYDAVNAELGGTTQILVPHEYDHLVWLPPSFGGVGAAGSVMYVNENYGHETGHGDRKSTRLNSSHRL